MLRNFVHLHNQGAKVMVTQGFENKNRQTKNSRKVATVGALALLLASSAPSFAHTLCEARMPWMNQADNMTLQSEDVQKLANYDLALVIDKSASMTYRLNQRNVAEKPNNVEGFPSVVNPADTISRWDWCKNQAANLANQIKKVLPNGINLSLFSNRYNAYNNVDAMRIEYIFSETEPTGGTHISQVLSHHFDEYFASRDAGKTTKPLLLAVITDGCPEDGEQTRLAIINATKKMQRADEIKVAILQVGNDRRAPRLLGELDNDLVAQHAKYDIVEIHSFTEMKENGLARTLASVVANDTLATISSNHL